MDVYFTSDLHIDHGNIGKFRRLPEGYEGAEGNTEWLREEWHKRSCKRSMLISLGDTAFSSLGIMELAMWQGRMRGILGNHDLEHVTDYMRAMDILPGLYKYKGMWLSHAPIHTDELRGKFNIHGHTHYHEIDDWRYVNVCCDNLWEKTGSPFIRLDELRSLLEKRRKSQEVIYEI